VRNLQGTATCHEASTLRLPRQTSFEETYTLKEQQSTHLERMNAWCAGMLANIVGVR